MSRCCSIATVSIINYKCSHQIIWFSEKYFQNLWQLYKLTGSRPCMRACHSVKFIKPLVNTRNCLAMKTDLSSLAHHHKTRHIQHSPYTLTDLEFSRLESWSRDVSRPVFTSLRLGSWSWSWNPPVSVTVLVLGLATMETLSSSLMKREIETK